MVSVVERVQNNAGTTGGVTGRGFGPGQSGNPGGRPRGLARATRELIGDDGLEIARFWYETMRDESLPIRVRLEASRLLAERGWGRAPAVEPAVEDEASPLLPLEFIDAQIELLTQEIRAREAAQTRSASALADPTPAPRNLTTS
jgi:hypothetical protein